MPSKDEKKAIDEVLKRMEGMPDPEIPILQGVQDALGYVGKEYLEYIASKTGISLTKLYGIVTFYPLFKIHPPGKNIVKMCQGTACHVRGGAKVLAEFQKLEGIGPGETTEDRVFSLEVVRCLGCCGISPVIMINDDTYARMTPAKLPEVLRKYRGGSK
jgi:NADH:ubiquinone oxidoreductase subunit E